MTLTVNQILVICLIAELVIFLIVLIRLAASALGLLKNVKVTLGHTQELADFSKKAVEECKAKVNQTANVLIDNARTVDKAVCIAAAVLVVINYHSIVRKFTPLGKGRIGAALNSIEKSKAERDLRKARKEVKYLRKSAKKDAKQTRKAAKLAREAAATK